MATELHKPVRRLLQSADRKGRRLIVSLEPGDIITFRPKGAKRTVSLYIGHAFTLAQIVTIDREYVARMKQYKADKSLGLKRRKPIKPCLPFSKIYWDALK